MKIVLSSVDQEHKQSLVESLVREGLVACIHSWKVESAYVWEDSLHLEPEASIMMKVPSQNMEALRTRFLELHPYACPEFVVLDIDPEQTHQPYLDWVKSKAKVL